MADMPSTCGGYILRQGKAEDVDKMSPSDRKQVRMMSGAKAHWERVFGT